MGKTAINLIDLSISQSTDKLSGHPFNNTVYPYPPPWVFASLSAKPCKSHRIQKVRKSSFEHPAASESDETIRLFSNK